MTSARHARWLLLVLLSAAACLSTRARRAASEGDPLAAADLYHEAYDRYGWPRLRERRDEARTLAVAEALAEVERLRGSGRGAEARRTLDALVQRTHAWDRPFAADEALAVDRFVEWAAREDHGEALAKLDEGRPLEALEALPHRAGLRHRRAYARARAELVEDIEAAGRARCRALQAEPAPSHRLPDLVALYCRHFEAPVAPSRQPVDACDRVAITTVAELPEAEREGLEHHVRRLLERTPYVHPRGDCTIDVQLTASRTLETTRASTTVVARWTESVPDTRRVLRTEHYTESQLQTVTTYVRESYTTTRYRSGQCGYGSHSYSCSRPETQTHYRTVPKRETRWVSVPKSRQVWVTESYLRSEPRSRIYDAVKVAHAFAGAGRVKATLPGGATLELPWTSHHAVAGVEHDHVHAEAGLFPARVPPPSRESLAAVDLAALERAWSAMIATRLDGELCHAGADLDRAIACLLFVSAGAVPKAGREAIAGAMGERFESLAWMAWMVEASAGRPQAQ